MPITIPHALPAREALESENVFVMTDERAAHQDIRPLSIAIANLMPTMVATETQLLRLLANTPLQVEITLLRMGTHEARNTSAEHLEAFYTTFESIKNNKYDGLIITGAPVEQLEFEEVDYWPELCTLMDWSAEHVFSTMHVCWGAQAALYRRYGIGKYQLPHKVFGIFEHELLDPHSPIVRGFDEVFPAPHSRHTEVRREDLENVPDLSVLAVSQQAGVFLASSTDGRQLYVTGHPEYERYTLAGEYERDVTKGLPIHVPHHYYPDDDPTRPPVMTWRSHAHLLYGNWLNYCVYQRTPFDIQTIPAPMPEVSDAAG